MGKEEIKKLSLCGMFVAFIAASAQICIPMPSGISFTLQTLAVALCGMVLGAKYSLGTIAVYIAIGACGLPVFSAFQGGVGVLFGLTGGFLFGFLGLALLCSLASKTAKKPLKILLFALSVIVCHAAGAVQFCVLSGNNIIEAIVISSLPYLLKDYASIAVAYLIAKKLKDKNVI